jgi:aspartyl-tRNA(Asn)/glutamyl-tRNA(Gln) amidotransferase subunit B
MNTKVEVKNMNSVRHVGDAIAFEIARQSAAAQAGEAAVLHTRLWDPDKKVTLPMRAKFEGPCVPDPSVPAIELTPAWIESLRARLPEMPTAKAERLVKEHGISAEDAAFLSADTDVADYFEALTAHGVTAKMALHWTATQVLPAVRERGQEISASSVTPERLAGLLTLLARDEINANAAREVLVALFESDASAETIVNERGFRQISNTDELGALIDHVLAAEPAALADVRNGVGKAMGFLIGQVMQASQGKANPKLIKELLAKKLR